MKYDKRVEDIFAHIRREDIHGKTSVISNLIQSGVYLPDASGYDDGAVYIVYGKMNYALVAESVTGSYNLGFAVVLDNELYLTPKDTNGDVTASLVKFDGTDTLTVVGDPPADHKGSRSVITHDAKIYAMIKNDAGNFLSLFSSEGTDWTMVVDPEVDTGHQVSNGFLVSDNSDLFFITPLGDIWKLSGSSWTTTLDTSEPDAANGVKCLYSDSEGTILLATYAGHIFFSDGATEWDYFVDKTDKPMTYIVDMLIDNYDVYVLDDSNDVYYALGGTDGGYFLPYYHNPFSNDFINPSNGHLVYYSSGDSNFYISYDRFLCYLDNVNKKTDIVIDNSYNAYTPPPLIVDQYIPNCVIDFDGFLYFGTTEGDLVRYSWEWTWTDQTIPGVYVKKNDDWVRTFPETTRVDSILATNIFGQIVARGNLPFQVSNSGITYDSGILVNIVTDDVLTGTYSIPSNANIVLSNSDIILPFERQGLVVVVKNTNDVASITVSPYDDAYTIDGNADYTIPAYGAATFAFDGAGWFIISHFA